MAIRHLVHRAASWSDADVLRATMTMTLLLACGARTDLGGVAHVDASAPDACTEVEPTTCSQPACSSGTCVTMVGAQTTYSVAVDEAHVFWSTPSALMRADKCGANARVIVGCTDEIALLALDVDHVYYRTIAFHQDTPHTTLFRVSKDGSDATQLADLDGEIDTLAVDGDLFFEVFDPLDARLVRMQVAGGSQTTLFTGQVSYAMALDAKLLFFGAGSSLMRMNEDGSAQTVLADLKVPGISDGVASIVLDETWVYANDGCGDIQRVKRDGTGLPEPVRMASKANGSKCSGEPLTAVDATSVYVTASGDGTLPPAIFRVPKSGGSLETVLGLDKEPRALALDPSGMIFWGDDASLWTLASK